MDLLAAFLLSVLGGVVIGVVIGVVALFFGATLAASAVIAGAVALLAFALLMRKGAQGAKALKAQRTQAR